MYIISRALKIPPLLKYKKARNFLQCRNVADVYRDRLGIWRQRRPRIVSSAVEQWISQVDEGAYVESLSTHNISIRKNGLYFQIKNCNLFQLHLKFSE